MDDNMGIPPAAEESKNNTTTIIIIAVVAAVLILCCCCLVTIILGYRFGDCLTYPNDPILCPLAVNMAHALM